MNIYYELWCNKRTNLYVVTQFIVITEIDENDRLLDASHYHDASASSSFFKSCAIDDAKQCAFCTDNINSNKSSYFCSHAAGRQNNTTRLLCRATAL